MSSRGGVPIISRNNIAALNSGAARAGSSLMATNQTGRQLERLLLLGLILSMMNVKSM
jgi:hypothetical protein